MVCTTLNQVCDVGAVPWLDLAARRRDLPDRLVPTQRVFCAWPRLKRDETKVHTSGISSWPSSSSSPISTITIIIIINYEYLVSPQCNRYLFPISYTKCTIWLDLAGWDLHTPHDLAHLILGWVCTRMYEDPEISREELDGPLNCRSWYV